VPRRGLAVAVTEARAPASAPRTGGRILVDQLVRHGVEVIFGVPGESYLAALDALYDAPVRYVNARHEAGAANMAEAHARLTGRPGVCFVTRAPGAAHGAVGVHTAFQDSTPMLYLVGQVPRRELGREALQEVDLRTMFAPLAKWAEQVLDAERIPELVRRAFQVATSGRPGPVVLALPEDVLEAEASAADAPAYAPSMPAPAAAELARVRSLLAAAERPLVVIGGGGWSAAAARAAQAFAEASLLPIACSFRCHDYIDNRSPSYAGHLGTFTNPALARRVREADLLLVIGDRLGDVTTASYRLLEPPAPRQVLIHVHPDPDEIGRVYAPALAVVSCSEPFLAALEPVDGSRWAARTAQAHAEQLAWSTPEPARFRLDLGLAVAALGERLGDSAIITGDAGNFSGWVSRYLPATGYGSQVMPASGAMGYGVPAAIAAKLTHPERPVVCFVGDGGFQMSGLELATAAQEGLAIIVIVVSNGSYGTIRAFQERAYPGRVIATRLENPDFAALAAACGAHGETVEDTEAVVPALERALRAARPALIELRADPQALTPTDTVDSVRAAAGWQSASPDATPELRWPHDP
jgi:acetolactate synthase-1/2/3 large subunit